MTDNTVSKGEVNPGVGPKVSVLMPVFNGMPYLGEAIDSILNQTFTNFEFIIVDDCSTDDTVKFIESYQDPRIRLFHNQKNLGQTSTLNEGLKCVKAPFVARIDADDVSYPDRLEKQVRFLEESGQEMVLVGSDMEVIDAEGKFVKYLDRPSDDGDLRFCLLFGSPISGGTMMIRTDLLRDHLG